MRTNCKRGITVQTRIYDHRDFWSVLSRDVRKACGSIVIHVPYIGQGAMERWQPLLAERAAKGVLVCVVLQRPRDWDRLQQGTLVPEAMAKVRQLHSFMQWLESLGAHVELRDRIHAKLALIDEHILWEGSLNFLSHLDTTEHLRRSINRDEVNEVKKRHKLDGCKKCDPHRGNEQARISGMVTLRRNQLEISQSDLSARVNCKQSHLSRVEAGQVSLISNLCTRIVQVLGLSVVLVPSHLVRAVDHFVIDAMNQANKSPQQ
jgi:Helix-turn-helix